VEGGIGPTPINRKSRKNTGKITRNKAELREPMLNMDRHHENISLKNNKWDTLTTHFPMDGLVNI